MTAETKISLASSFIRNSIFLLCLCFLLVPQVQAQPQQAPQTDAQDGTKIQSPDQHIEAITLRKKAQEKERSEIAERLKQVKEADSAALQQQLKLSDQIASLLGLQIAEWQRRQDLDAKNAAYLEEMARLGQAPESDKVFSLLELDRAREQLDVESSRVKVVRAKVDLAKEALDDVQCALKQASERPADKEATASALAKVTALERDCAEQKKILRELELANEEKAFTVHETQLQLLRKQIEFLQKHTEFDDKAFKEQINGISKLDFELKRDLAGFKDQQIIAQSLLDRARKQLESVPFEDARAIEETEARNIELAVLKAKIDATQRELALLAEQRTIWQKRRDVVEQTVARENLPKWRSEAKADIARIDQEQETMRLWLSDWRSRLNAVNSKAADSDPQTAVWQKRQQVQIQSILDTLTDISGALDQQRTLLKHLIDDIDTRSSQHSLREWLSLMVHLEIQHNTLLDWACAFAIASLSFIALYVLRWFLIRALKRAAERSHFSQANELLDTVKRANLLFFLVMSLFLASLTLTLPPATDAAIGKIVKVCIVFQVAMWSSGLVRAWILRIIARKTKGDGSSMGALAILNFTSQVVLWSITALLILQNLGINVTALIAGLGIGGIAVALALQRILNDLFASLSIVIDKPFVIGDFITLDDFLGTVEHIGVKTTRLRSLTGEQIICANGELLNTRIRNFKHMQERRVVFRFGVVYQTPAETLRQIPGLIKAIVEACADTRFDRAHFFEYGEFSLNFEVVYYVLSPDYNLYMDIQQTINLDIYRQFQREGIEFAFPTQVILVPNLNPA